ncbi:DUF883 family protein [Denitromonas halophila]|uniref:DUF883 domain-containing protein n=1 Tax=Denitromonas halophila TaxID=1629404 RepID=A0A557QKH2_9RHOO|nr:DUF883 family protein [Denitromonas halophila]TVO53406.1 DUF883 domain-containing protein [Denitromonas halophila]
MATETQEARDQLIEDFQKVIDDAEELLKLTANETGGKIVAVRDRAEENLREVRRKLNALEDDVLVKAKAAAKATGQLVQENPWQAVAIAGALGLLLGMLSGRR